MPTRLPKNSNHKEPSSPFETPMMKQYLEIKNKYPDCIVFFRLGDFYEMFMEDAKLGSSLLDITLTSRDRGKDGRVPMAGVPYHAADSYISKLVKAGYKVAVCEQIGEITNETKLVERDVIRVITPGTLLDEYSLDRKENNYIVSLHFDEEYFGMAVADLSTGFFQSSQHDIKSLEYVLINDLTKYNPSECVLAPSAYEDSYLLKLLKTHKGINIYPCFDWDLYIKESSQSLKKHFNVLDLTAFNIESFPAAQKASAALLNYLKYTQKGNLEHFKKLVHLNKSDFLELDRATILNLELFNTIREGKKVGSFINLVDRTVTPMGGRLLKNWVTKPLIEISEINARFDAVEELISKSGSRSTINKYLAQVVDIERVLSRLSIGIGNPRDLANLSVTFQVILELKDVLNSHSSYLIKESAKPISNELKALTDYLKSYIADTPPLDPKNGGFIKPGVDEELDKLRLLINKSKDYISNLEQEERVKTGINSLKVKFNQVFGYYIEVTKSNLSLVPSTYFRKQTLVNAERFITPELKEHEEIILTAEEKIKDIEFKIFQDVVIEVLSKTELLQKISLALSQIDCLCSFASLAREYNYVRPVVHNNGVTSLRESRHPVVEVLMDSGAFVPNDLTLNNIDHQLLIITGPNMAGKSVYIRQVALLYIMAQMGCFVPALNAEISIADKIFVRSGAADYITGGLSTFMVEMVETAYILNNATSRSLIVMDEIGRGTSTYDGISIAWAVAEHLVETNDFTPKTLFATHYHELQDLESKFPDKIKNYHVSVDDSQDLPVFLHKVKPGKAAHSFGIEVAQMAGIPVDVCNKAYEVLDNLRLRFDARSSQTVSVKKLDHSSIALDMLQKLDLSRTTPLEALNILAELTKIISKEKNE